MTQCATATCASSRRPSSKSPTCAGATCGPLKRMLSSSTAWRASVKGGGPSLSCCPDAQSTLCAIVICAVRVRHRHALSSQEEDESHRDESGNEDTATSGRRHGSACTQPGSTVAAPTRGALVRWCAGAQVRRCAVGSSQLHEVQDYSCIHRPYRLQLCVLRSQYRSADPRGSSDAFEWIMHQRRSLRAVQREFGVEGVSELLSRSET